MKAEASITGKRQLTIPKDLYVEMGLKITDKLVFSKNEKGEIVINKKEINTLDVCPICNREVLNEDTMVIKNSQKYHEECWFSNKLNKSKYIANKVTTHQSKTLDKVYDKIAETKLEMIKNLKDNQTIVDTPVILTFMENKKARIGSIREFDSSVIISCNPLD